MTGAFELIAIAILVAVVLVASYALAGRLSQRRVERDFDNPKDILTAVDIYVKYGRRRAAIKLLEAGLERYPGHVELEQRLAQLNEQKK